MVAGRRVKGIEVYFRGYPLFIKDLSVELKRKRARRKGGVSLLALCFLPKVDN
jgi:hypothetical protein